MQRTGRVNTSIRMPIAGPQTALAATFSPGMGLRAINSGGASTAGVASPRLFNDFHRNSTTYGKATAQLHSALAFSGPHSAAMNLILTPTGNLRVC
jgi:hypothetical protein